jgi:hypothetical protein
MKSKTRHSELYTLLVSSARFLGHKSVQILTVALDYQVDMKPVVQWMHAPISLASEVLQSVPMGNWTPDDGMSSNM